MTMATGEFVGIETMLIDVGSTVVKCVRVGADGVISDHSRRRNLGEPVSEQVDTLIRDVGAEFGDAEIRICSSANGGLRVGVLCLTLTFSGAIAVHAMEAVGANIIYSSELRGTHGHKPQEHVDLLVVVAGVDDLGGARAQDALRGADLTAFPHDRLVFAGHHTARATVDSMWPGAETVSSPLRSSLSPHDDALPRHVRTTYLADIESKRDLMPLIPRSAVPIEPTPAIVSGAFARMLAASAGPELVLDVGGATTDVHYSKDLIDEQRVTGSLSAYPDIGRYVYTALGTDASQHPTLRSFLRHSRCTDALKAIYSDRSQNIYAGLLEGEVPEGLLAYVCVFLALSQLWGDAERGRDDNESPPPLNLQRLSSLGITGGAARIVSEPLLQRLLATVGHPPLRMRIVVDQQYRWWALGMLSDERLTPEIWRSIVG